MKIFPDLFVYNTHVPLILAKVVFIFHMKNRPPSSTEEVFSYLFYLYMLIFQVQSYL